MSAYMVFCRPTAKPKGGATVWGIACAIGIFLNCSPLVSSEDAKPNIVVILADDLGFGDVSCYNPQSKIPTPNIDRLAAQGIRFLDAHSPSALCTPTRYGLLTGRYAWRTSLKSGVLGGYSQHLIDPQRETIASVLKRAGYRTAVIGKWHLGMDFATTDGMPLEEFERFTGIPGNADWAGTISNGPNALGFDYFFGCSASWDMPPYAWIENDRLVNPNLIVAPEGNRFGRYGVKSPGMNPEDALPALARKAVDFIANSSAASANKPFFLYFPLTAPHAPIVPGEAFNGASQAGKYGDFVVEVDWTVGEVMGALQRAGIVDDTILIFTSDNGPERLMEERKEIFGHDSAVSLLGCKRDNWEGGHRIPFISRWPGTIPAGTAAEEVICLTDLIATFAEIAGEELPDGAGPDSYSIVSALKGSVGESPTREAIVHHSGRGFFAVRQGKWKLIMHSGSGGNDWHYKGDSTYSAYYAVPVQLYNIEADPGETTNLAPTHPSVVNRLASLMSRYVERGRSTPGSPLANDTPNDWKQLDTLKVR